MCLMAASARAVDSGSRAGRQRIRDRSAGAGSGRLGYPPRRRSVPTPTPRERTASGPPLSDDPRLLRVPVVSGRFEEHLDHRRPCPDPRGVPSFGTSGHSGLPELVGQSLSPPPASSGRKVETSMALEVHDQLRLVDEVGEPIPWSLSARDEEPSVDVEHPDLDRRGWPDFRPIVVMSIVGSSFNSARTTSIGVDDMACGKVHPRQRIGCRPPPGDRAERVARTAMP